MARTENTHVHVTHHGEIVTGVRLQKALNAVADELETLAYNMRNTPGVYAEHVTEAEKNRTLKEDLKLAKNIRERKSSTLSTWQQVNTYLTGECVALLDGL